MFTNSEISLCLAKIVKVWLLYLPGMFTKLIYCVFFLCCVCVGKTSTHSLLEEENLLCL